jgi:hypothetical protein
MANTIRIKKRASGGASGAPSSLAPSELAYSEVDNILHYGFGDAGGGAASSVISIAGSGAYCTLTGNQTLSGNKTFTGTVDLSGATLSGNTTFSNNLVVTGDLTVNGTTTTVNSTTVTVDDKNLELGSVASPDDTTADGGGITLKGATDKTFNWVNSTDSWTASEHIDLASGKEFKINGTSVLSGSALGSGVTGSSLTSVGTVTSGTWSATDIGVAHGGTGASTASAARTNLGLVIGTNVQAYDAQLADVAGLAVTDGGFIVGDGSNFVLETGATARTSIGAQTLAADLTSLSSCQTGGAAALAALTSTEIAVLDGVTATTAELNKLDGDTAATSTTLAAADRMVINDAGTMVQVALSDLVTFLENGTASSFELDGGTF